MDRITIRFAVHLDIVAKPDQTLVFTDVGEMILRSSSGDVLLDRESVIKKILLDVERNTLADDDLPWYVEVVRRGPNGVDL